MAKKLTPKQFKKKYGVSLEEAKKMSVNDFAHGPVADAIVREETKHVDRGIKKILRRKK